MEDWRAIAGWVGAYEVSDRGHVRSLDRTVVTRLGPKKFKGRILAATPSGSGYRVVVLTAPGRRECHNVHVLVARAFIGPCPAGQEVCHNNGRAVDCWLDNLRYDTRQANALDRHEHGTMNQAGCPGEMNGLAKLTDVAVLDIRADTSSTLEALSTKYNVSISAVHLARSRKTWKHLP